jgi:hypothetical protein
MNEKMGVIKGHRNEYIELAFAIQTPQKSA